MTWLRLELSRLREHKFSHNFQNCISPPRSCAMDIESRSHFFLHCPLFDDKTITLLSTLNKMDCKLIETNESSLIETLLFGNSLFGLKKTPSFFLNASIGYILSTKRFEEALLQQVLLTTTKYSCRSNHPFILSEFFNLLYLYLDLATFTFFCYSQALLEFFDAWWLQFLV